MAKKQDVGEKPVVEKRVQISALNEEVIAFEIRGTAPYVQNAFPEKARATIRATQAAGATAKKGTKREPKDFDECFAQSLHRGPNGEYGIPAPAFRNAMIDACRMCGYKMTYAKMSVFVEGDFLDVVDSTPLVKITKGTPRHVEHMVRTQGSCDIRARGMFDPGWEATVRVRFDADQFTPSDLANLMVRVGRQVGIGEGRHFSKDSCGMGWGEFGIVEEAKKKTRGVAAD